MRKRIKTTAGILFLGLLCVSGTYGYFSDTLQVVNHISVGDIKISMEEYEKKGTKEVPYSNTGEILPEMCIRDRVTDWEVEEYLYRL